VEHVQKGCSGRRFKKLVDFLLYTLEQGPIEKGIIKTALQQGRGIPERIQNAPDCPLGLQLFYLSWEELSTTRALAFGLGPIPWDAIDYYCRTYDIKGEQREDMFVHVRALDNAYLKWADKK
jgi:hypothetical protein